jgi:DNA-directed RNA polymerase specialized sigma24 family protein
LTSLSRRRRPNYTEEETRALVEHYEHLRELGLRVTTDWFAKRVDLDDALERLPAKYWEVVLLHGLIGFSLVETAQLLHVSHQAVSKRYRQGLEETTYWINGGE